ncbi:MAG: TonB-dependent receptor [Pseudomonadota bacterium]
MAHHRHLLYPLAALALFSPCAGAADDNAIAQVQIHATQAEQRQRDTIATTTVSHEQLLRHGDQSLTDALKRLPGLSVESVTGQGSAIRMRGLGQGYTQILLNGAPLPAGFSLDTLDPELVERVEILRGATAELSNQAIAGTINIVLKKAITRERRDAGISAAQQHGRSTPGATLQLAGRDGALAYTVAATASRKRSSAPGTLAEAWTDAVQRPVLLRRTAQTEEQQDDMLAITPRVSWRFDGGDTLAWQSYLGWRRIAHRHGTAEQALLGPHSAFPASAARYDGHERLLRSDLEWRHRLAGGATVELKLGASASRRNALFRYDGYARADDAGPGAAPAGSHLVASGPAETSYTSAGAWRSPVGEYHALALGWDGSAGTRTEYRGETLYDAAGQSQPGSELSYRATVRRLAVYLQDEWAVTPRWSLYLGLRREQLASASGAGQQAPFSSRTAMWSPSLQSHYRLDEHDVLRAALSRSYKAPTLAQLVPRRYTTDNNNQPTNPDTEGNPALRPELAWGLDAAYEHALAGDGLLSAGAYLRRIRDVTAERLFQSGAAWIEHPVNLGDASAHGVELEASLPLTALWNGAAGATLRANVARNWSAVHQVPGPDNRLAAQAPYSAGVGLDYRLPGGAWEAGADLHWQGGGPVQLADGRAAASGATRQLDLYARWQANRHTSLRLAAGGLLQPAGRESVSYTDAAGSQRSTTLTPAAATLRFTLERAF